MDDDGYLDAADMWRKKEKWQKNTAEIRTWEKVTYLFYACSQNLCILPVKVRDIYF